jgi:hypothetical protein
VEPTLACTLDPGRYRSRTASLSALAEHALRSREPTERGERLTFDPDEQVERELRAAVAAEASCCAFLTMDLERHDDRLVLDIAGSSPQARSIIAELFA